MQAAPRLSLRDAAFDRGSFPLVEPERGDVDKPDHVGGVVAERGRAHQSVDEEGFVWLTEDDSVNHFAGDVDPVKAKVLYAVQQPLSASVLSDVVMNVPG
jgi:hypothetical protein